MTLVLTVIQDWFWLALILTVAGGIGAYVASFGGDEEELEEDETAPTEG